MSATGTRTAARGLCVAIAFIVAFAPALAEARAGKGSSSGSRGARTDTVAPRTNTAPAPAQTFQRSNPAQSAPAQAPVRQVQPVPAQAPRPAAQPQRSFVSGVLGGAAAFVSGALIANALRSTGLFDGAGAMVGALAAIINMLLIGLLAAAALAFLRPRPREEPAIVIASNPVAGSPDPAPRPGAPRATFGRRGAVARG